MDKSNKIHESAKIIGNVKFGNYNYIGKNVEIIADENSIVEIGNNNTFHDDTRIIANGNISIKHWNTFHNQLLLISKGGIFINSNCWFGQNTVLDGTGKLIIGDSVRVGMYSQIWTHSAAGELIEGCNLFFEKTTILKNDVWLVGTCIVNPGAIINNRAIIIQGNIKGVIKENSAHEGNPLKENLFFKYAKKSINQKFKMMTLWAEEYISKDKNCNFSICDNKIFINDQINEIIIHKSIEINNLKTLFKSSHFCLSSKLFYCVNSPLEQKFYRFISGHKARFTPVYEL